MHWYSESRRAPGISRTGEATSSPSSMMRLYLLWYPAFVTCISGNSRGDSVPFMYLCISSCIWCMWRWVVFFSWDYVSSLFQWLVVRQSACRRSYWACASFLEPCHHGLSGMGVRSASRHRRSLMYCEWLQKNLLCSISLFRQLTVFLASFICMFYIVIF